MRILFAISLVALAALLWASVSIAQHIYRSRKQQRKAAREPRKNSPATTTRSASATGHQPARPTILRDTNETQQRKAS